MPALDDDDDAVDQGWCDSWKERKVVDKNNEKNKNETKQRTHTHTHWEGKMIRPQADWCNKRTHTHMQRPRIRQADQMFVKKTITEWTRGNLPPTAQLQRANIHGTHLSPMELRVGLQDTAVLVTD